MFTSFDEELCEFPRSNASMHDSINQDFQTADSPKPLLRPLNEQYAELFVYRALIIYQTRLSGLCFEWTHTELDPVANHVVYIVVELDLNMSASIQMITLKRPQPFCFT